MIYVFSFDIEALVKKINSFWVYGWLSTPAVGFLFFISTYNSYSNNNKIQQWNK